MIQAITAEPTNGSPSVLPVVSTLPVAAFPDPLGVDVLAGYSSRSGSPVAVPVPARVARATAATAATENS